MTVSYLFYNYYKYNRDNIRVKFINIKALYYYYNSTFKLYIKIVIYIKIILLLDINWKASFLPVDKF